MFGKKGLAKKMIKGIDIIKLVLYKILIDEFSEKYKDRGEYFYKTLAAAIGNEIFGHHSEQSQQAFNNNKEVAINEIKNLGENHPDLKRPITDALRVFVQANFILSGKPQENLKDVFENAMKWGIFIKGGEKPDPKTFLDMANELGKKYDVIQ